MLEHEASALMTQVLERLQISRISPYSEIGEFHVFDLRKLSHPFSLRGSASGGMNSWTTEEFTMKNFRDGAVSFFPALRYRAVNVNPEDPQNHVSLYLQVGGLKLVFGV